MNFANLVENASGNIRSNDDGFVNDEEDDNGSGNEMETTYGDEDR